MKFEEYRNAPVEQRLQFWISMPRGGTLPSDWPVNAGWDAYIRDVCAHALYTINELKGPPKKAPWHRRARAWLKEKI